MPPERQQPQHAPPTRQPQRPLSEPQTPAPASATAACRVCGGTGVRIEPEGATAMATVCACSERCAICRGAKFLFERDGEGRDTARLCSCEVRRQRIRLYNEAEIPAKYADARLADSRRDKDNNEAFLTFSALAKDYARGHQGLLLMGGPGVGKTYLLCGFLHELIFRHGVPAQFRDFFHLLADLRSGYGQDKPESELIGPLVEVEVLAIDELGKGRNTPWEQNILDVIISHRYNGRKTTIFTTNYAESRSETLAEPLRGKDSVATEAELVRDTLADRVGPRIYSRLKEMCHFVLMKGRDRREYLTSSV
jgi:DNA replication protein DnaC